MHQNPRNLTSLTSMLPLTAILLIFLIAVALSYLALHSDVISMERAVEADLRHATSSWVPLRIREQRLSPDLHEVHYKKE